MILILLSPTKKQTLSEHTLAPTTPIFIDEASAIMNRLKSLNITELKDLFKASDSIATQNLDRFKRWESKPERGDSTAAIYAYTGEVFSNLAPETLEKEQMDYLKNRLVIFSGLYGVLRCSDSIMPYRLDIKDSIKIEDRTLYSFWKDRINNYLVRMVEENGIDIIVNLASKEYTKNIDFKGLNCVVITPEFRTLKDGKLKNIPMWSKKMRGLMTKELACLETTTLDDINKIVLPGYSRDKTTNPNEYLYIKSL